MWLSRAVLPVSLTLLGVGHCRRYPAPGTMHTASLGLRVWMAETQHHSQRKTLAASQAHFHSQPGLGAPLVLLDKAQHGSGFDLLLSQVWLSSHSSASSASHCCTPRLHGFEAWLQKLDCKVAVLVMLCHSFSFQVGRAAEVKY